MAMPIARKAKLVGYGHNHFMFTLSHRSAGRNEGLFSIYYVFPKRPRKLSDIRTRTPEHGFMFCTGTKELDINILLDRIGGS